MHDISTQADLIECFTTTFLRAHSWLNWVDEDNDEDEVGLKEKPEDTRYITHVWATVVCTCMLSCTPHKVIAWAVSFLYMV